MNLIGEVEGRNAFIIDDEIDTGGTVLEAVRVLRDHGARDITVACYHAILSGPGSERLQEADLREIIVTDSVPVPADRT